MNHLPAFALCLGGFALLVLAMRRPQRDLFGEQLGLMTICVLRAFSVGALLAALGALVAWQGWSLGLVMFSGHTSVSAGIVFCMLVGYARVNR